MSFLKSLFAKKPEKPAMSHGEARAQKMDARLESFRKGGLASRDAAIRGSAGTSSARDYLAKSLGKPTGPVGGSSIGRLGNRTVGGNMPTQLPPKLPPMRPMGK